MNGDKVLHKTAVGLEEIQSSSRRLNSKLRTILIMVDGIATCDELRAKVSLLTHAEEFNYLDESITALINAGYITDNIAAAVAGFANEEFMVPSNDSQWTEQNFNGIKHRLSAIASEILGDQAGKVLKKLDEAPHSKEGIYTVLSDCKKLVRLFIDEKKANELEKKCNALLDRIF